MLPGNETSSRVAPPPALGLRRLLPPGWTLVATAGTHVPPSAPAPGDTGALGRADLTVPEKSAEFSVTVGYPVGLDAAQILRAWAIWRPAPRETPAAWKIVLAAP